ncbi:MAG: alpha/beta fold hydrolase [Kiritimatiellia bacterium]
MQGNRQATKDWSVAGSLVAFPAAGGRKPRRLDGFYRPAAKTNAPLLAFVHGMGSNFYRSALKKAFLETAPARGCAVLSFNNRGAERGTEDEKFRACLADLDAAAAFARRRGHRKIVFVGHSTGCQKIAFWQAQRRHPAVAGLVLLAPADDYATMQRDLGRRFDAKVAWARNKVAQGQGDAQVAGLYERFTAARFLSVADPRRAEANVFRYAGALTQFRRVTCPLLAVFGAEEEFAAIPPADMLAILRKKTQSRRFADWLIPDADHGFHGMEKELAAAVCRWAREIAP